MAGIGGPEPRIDPWTLNLDRTLRGSRRMYLVEERDESGTWIERERFGSYGEAAGALDHLSVGSERYLRIRELNPRRRLTLIAAIVAGVVLLAGTVWLVYILAR